MKRLLPAIFSLILILGCIGFLYKTHKPEEIPVERSVSYIASDTNTAMVFRKENSLLYEYKELVRGTDIINRNIEVEVNDGEFIFSEIELDGDVDANGTPIVYYIPSDNLCSTLDKIIQEDTCYVRTPATVYLNDSDAKITSFVKKGTELAITGYSGLREDGSVEMYKISTADGEGYVYSKYLVFSEKEAQETYSQISTIHDGRDFTYELYGGSASNLDWFPVSKPQLESGPLLENARAIYINSQAANPDYIDQYIQLAQESGANAMVVDIKDGILTYESPVSAELSPSSYQYSYLTEEQFRTSAQKIKDAGLYIIGRIVVFNDDYYAYDHPDECIITDLYETWPSAYSRDCWYYNVALGQEAVKEFGFNEIQFDYVRFPESAFTMSESTNTDFRNVYSEEKAEAIQNFCFYAADQIHRAGAYISIDVFGECADTYVTAYGQYWPAISNVVDVISGMPYTDHYGAEKDTWSFPYTTVYEWAVKAAMRQTEIRTPAIARTWITGYDTPYWAPSVTYGSQQLIEQAQALYDSGLTGGFIPWNGISDINKYYSYAEIWNYQYDR